jgi:hypothetical protein
MTTWHKDPIAHPRGLLYRLARLLGWVQVIEDAATGHPNRAVKRLANKVIGRKVVRHLYLK